MWWDPPSVAGRVSRQRCDIKRINNNTEVSSDKPPKKRGKKKPVAFNCQMTEGD